MIRKFREKFEVSNEAQGGRVKLVGDDTTAREGKRERLRPILDLAREEIGKMSSDSTGYVRLRDLLARMRTRRKNLDAKIEEELGKDYKLRKWTFFALFNDIFDLKDRDRAGGDVRLKPTTQRRLTVKRPPRPPAPPRP